MSYRISGGQLVSINPVNQSEVGSVAITTESEVEAIVNRSKAAQKSWSKLSLEKGVSYLQR